MANEQRERGGPGPLKTVIERSSGGVVSRDQDGQMHVVLIATQEGSRWGLPKGQVQRGESSLEAARREVREETGLQVIDVEPLASIEYWYRRAGIRVHKLVDFYLFEYESGDVANHDSEVDEAAWFPIDDAIARASYRSEIDVLRTAKKAWAEKKQLPS